MAKLSIAVAAVLVAITAMFGPSLTAQQSAPRFEYVRVAPYTYRTPSGASAVLERVGYKACVAASSDWTCRDFQSLEPADAALRTTLNTLGNEGWELVSAVNEEPSQYHTGLTYLFKRAR